RPTVFRAFPLVAEVQPMSHASGAGTTGVPFSRTSAARADAVDVRAAGEAGCPRAALVTGASSGIGAAVARRLSARGWRLVLNGRDGERLVRVARAASAAVFPADLTRPGAEYRLTRFALEHAGRVDLLVAGAGIGWAGDFRTMPPSALEEVVETDLLATLRLVRQV